MDLSTINTGSAGPFTLIDRVTGHVFQSTATTAGALTGSNVGDIGSINDGESITFTNSVASSFFIRSELGTVPGWMEPERLRLVSGAPIIVSDPDSQLAVTVFGPNDIQITATTAIAGGPTATWNITTTSTTLTVTQTGGGDPWGSINVSIGCQAIAEWQMTKSTTSSPIFAGDTLYYWFAIQNTGNVSITSASIADTKCASAPVVTGGDSDGDGKIDWNETHLYACTSIPVTQAEVDNGQVDNSATATGIPDLGTLASVSDAVSVAIPPNPNLTITKSADDDTLRAAGDVITYTYVVTNTGNVTINGVTINDVHNGSGPAPSPSNEALLIDDLPSGDSTDAGFNGTWDTLAPGDSVRFTGSYTVTQSDVDTLQ